jgi:drug/metabolite transporter (DMT)-like permease
MDRAVGLAVLSAVMMGGMAFAAKIAALAGFSGPQIAFFRFLFGLFPLIFFARELLATRGVRFDLLFYRCTSASAAVVLYFLAIEHGTVGGATLLNSTAPVFAAILSIVFLRERMSRRLLVMMAVALTGVVLTANSFPSGFGRWELAALLSAVASAAAVTSMRAARRDENIWSVYGSITIFGLLCTAPLAWTNWRTPSAPDWLPLLATGALAFGGQVLMTASLRWVNAVTVGVVAQLAVVVSMLLGYFFLGEALTLRLVAAALLTTGGVAGVLLFARTPVPPVTVAAVAVVAEESQRRERDLARAA